MFVLIIRSRQLGGFKVSANIQTFYPTGLLSIKNKNKRIVWTGGRANVSSVQYQTTAALWGFIQYYIIIIIITHYPLLKSRRATKLTECLNRLGRPLRSESHIVTKLNSASSSNICVWKWKSSPTPEAWCQLSQVNGGNSSPEDHKHYNYIKNLCSQPVGPAWPWCPLGPGPGQLRDNLTSNLVIVLRYEASVIKCIAH